MEDEQKIMEHRLKLVEIRDKVMGNGLYINKVPKKTKQEFIAWATEEYEDDWGFALKGLMDFKNGVLTSQNEVLIEQIGILNEQVRELQVQVDSIKNQQPQENKKIVRSVSGNVIIGKEE